MVMNVASHSRLKPRGFVLELVVVGSLSLALAGVALMFTFWPFRYREVHPLLQQTFRSRVDVKSYHRTYFPHPGYVAEGLVFYRHGDTHIPPLATIDRMTVIGTWTALLFHPHRLYEIRLSGLHVQVPPPGTKARKMDFDQGVVSSSRQKIVIETIVADGTTLDFLPKDGNATLRFQFPALQVHNVKPSQPLMFFAHVEIPKPPGMVLANGWIGPIHPNDYAGTPLSGTYSLLSADLSKLHGVSGNAMANGHYSGTLANIEVLGKASISGFRSGSAQPVQIDADYHLTVNPTNGDVEIHNTQVKSGGSVISAGGSVAGSPKRLSITIATKDSPVGDLLKMVQRESPSVAGTATFKAAVEVGGGPGEFLQRMNLKGEISLAHIRFKKPDTQHAMDAFSYRVRKDPKGVAKDDPPPVTALAWSHTRFVNGIAYFPDVHVALPGAQALLQGNLNLIDTRIHLTGKLALEQDISHATTGWKSLMLKPLIPFFRHHGAGAIASIAVTGTAQHPRVGQNLLHDK
jgi:AsmA-like C-terminal region